MKALCDKCGDTFFITKMGLLHMDNGVDKTFFICSSCGKMYVPFYTNEEIRMLQDDMRKLTKFMSVMRSYEQSEELLKGIEELQQKIKSKMDALRIEVESK